MYATDVDTDGNADLLLSHKTDITVGHGEYFSYNIRANAGRDQGVNLAFFATNSCA